MGLVIALFMCCILGFVSYYFYSRYKSAEKMAIYNKFLAEYYSGRLFDTNYYKVYKSVGDIVSVSHDYVVFSVDKSMSWCKGNTIMAVYQRDIVKDISLRREYIKRYGRIDLDFYHDTYVLDDVGKELVFYSKLF